MLKKKKLQEEVSKSWKHKQVPLSLISPHVIRCVVGPVGASDWGVTLDSSSKSDFCMEDHATPWHNRDCVPSYIDLNAFFLFFSEVGTTFLLIILTSHEKPISYWINLLIIEDRALNSEYFASLKMISSVRPIFSLRFHCLCFISVYCPVQYDCLHFSAIYC